MTENAEPTIQSIFPIFLKAVAAYFFVNDKNKCSYRQAGDGDNERINDIHVLFNYRPLFSGRFLYNFLWSLPNQAAAPGTCASTIAGPCRSAPPSPMAGGLPGPAKRRGLQG